MTDGKDTIGAKALEVVNESMKRREGDAVSDPDTSSEVEWPREIWAAERGEFEPNGWHVFSEFATVARFEGDTVDCEFHHYVDGDIQESLKKYYEEMLTQERAENAALQARVDELEAALEIAAKSILSTPESPDDYKVWVGERPYICEESAYRILATHRGAL